MNNSLAEAPYIPAWAREFKDSKIFFYNGASMAPLFKPGDLLCVLPSDLGRLHPGDIVVFNWAKVPDKPEYVVHRAISVQRDFLITRGDNNMARDDVIINQGNLVGLVKIYERRGRIVPIFGGLAGLIFSNLIFLKNILWRVARLLGWKLYSFIRQTGWVAKIWRPEISRINVMTDDGPMVKYRYRNCTVARWWPRQARFSVMKPFDLVIPRPNDPNKHAYLA